MTLDSRLLFWATLCFQVISITEMPPSDFSVLENFHFENHIQNWLWNSCLDLITKEMWLLSSAELNPLAWTA